MNSHHASRLPIVALLTVLWTIGIDLVCLALRGRPTPKPPQLVALLQGYTVVALALGLSLVLLGYLARFLGRRLPLRGAHSPALWHALVFGLASLPGAFLFGEDLVSGESISRNAYAPALQGAATLLVVLTTAASASVHVWMRHRALGVIGLTIATLLDLINGSVLVGLYQGFHVALLVIALTLSLVSIERLLPSFAWQNGLRAFLFAPLLPLAVTSGLLINSTSRDSGIRLSPALPGIAAAVLRPSHSTIITSLVQRQTEEALLPEGKPRGAAFGRPIKNVVLLVVDTMRGDVLPPRVATSPFLSSSDIPFLSKQLKFAQRFTNAYSQASRTNRSIPPTFHSLEAFEMKPVGTPSLGARLTQLGLAPRAVVPDWFFMPNAGRAAELLEQFDEVRSFRRTEQHKFTALATELLDSEDEQPFFLWLHYFGLHAPYFQGQDEDEDEDEDDSQTLPDRYRGAVRYMDEQLGLLFSEMERRDLLDDTLVVLMADHGEHLGERGLTHHGQGVSEAEVQVPLVFWVPGAKPSVTQALVGNIDVMPTIFELLGEDTSGMRGTSLVESMRGQPERSDRELYVLSGNNLVSGLLTQDHRLVYSHTMGHFELYERQDVEERVDLLGEDPELDARLITSLAQRNPALFTNDIDDPVVRRALVEKLEQLQANAPSHGLQTLVKFATLSDSPDVLAALDRLYERSPAPVKTLLFIESYEADPLGWTKRAEALLRNASTVEDELSILSAMTRVGAFDLDDSLVTARLQAVSFDCTSTLAQAWLAYLTQRRKSPADQAELTRLLHCAMREDPRGTSGLLSAALRAITPKNNARGALSALEAEIVPLVHHENAVIAVEACRLLERATSDAALAALLDPKTLERDPRVAGAALKSLGSIQGADLTPYLLELGRDRRHMTAVVRTLAQVGDDRALPFLTELSETSKNGWMRNWAKTAIEAVSQRTQQSEARD